MHQYERTTQVNKKEKIKSQILKFHGQLWASKDIWKYFASLSIVSHFIVNARIFFHRFHYVQIRYSFRYWNVKLWFTLLKFNLFFHCNWILGISPHILDSILRVYMYTLGQEKYTIAQTPITCARMHMTHFYFKKGYEKQRPFVVMSLSSQKKSRWPVSTLDHLDREKNC